MPEPFKNFLRAEVIAQVASSINNVWPEFNQSDFIKKCCYQLEHLALKQRTDRLTDCLAEYLPDNFSHACTILLNSLGDEIAEGEALVNLSLRKGISGWPVAALCQYVAAYGQDHFTLSMSVLKEMTKRFSAEFSIRFFLINSPEKTLQVMNDWTVDENLHVRRLASEGCRPRLPWGVRLTRFVENPQELLPILEALKDDKQAYVRRSVANSINDIAKDHPEWVSKLMQKWLVGADKNRKRLIEHGCRTLIKQRHAKTLSLLGYDKQALSNVSLRLDEQVNFGEALTFEFSAQLLADKIKEPVSLMIDYIIDHKKANGSTSAKVFKWRKMQNVSLHELTLNKSHAIKAITTRKYYPGEHFLSVVINGDIVIKKPFYLVMDTNNNIST